MSSLSGLETFGTQVILALQAWGSPGLDAFFKAITFLGNREGYLVLLTLCYWCVNPRWGLRLLVLVMLSSAFNEILKSLLDLPRPDPAVVRQLVQESSFGFPSNHAQTGAVIVWGFLTARVRRPWFSALALVIIVLIGMSRVYLGIHFPHDVVGGWLLGAATLWLWLRREESLAAWWHRQPEGRQVLVSVAAPLAMLLLMPADSSNLYPNETGATLAGILMGAGLGAILLCRDGGFDVHVSWPRRARRYLIGILLVGGLYVVGGLLPEFSPWALDIVIRIVRYALIGLAAVWLAPRLFSEA